MAAAKLNISLLGYVDYCGYWGGCCACTMIVTHYGD